MTDSCGCYVVSAVANKPHIDFAHLRKLKVMIIEPTTAKLCAVRNFEVYIRTYFVQYNLNCSIVISWTEESNREFMAVENVRKSERNIQLNIGTTVIFKIYQRLLLLCLEQIANFICKISQDMKPHSNIFFI